MRHTLRGAVAVAASATFMQCAGAFAGPLFGQPVENCYQIRARVIGVIPQENSTVTPLMDEVDIGNALTGEVDFTYFINSRFSLEVIAALAKHEVRTARTDLDLGDALVVPPTLTLQYRILDEGSFQPYIGAGINYTLLKSSDSRQDLRVTYRDSFGYALQFGADYMITKNFLVNLDAKYIATRPQAVINGGEVTADIDLNPIIVGAGIGIRF